MLWVAVRIYGSQKLRSEDVAGEMVAKGLWREGPPHILGGQGWYPLLQPLARGDRSAGAQVALPRPPSRLPVPVLRLVRPVRGRAAGNDLVLVLSLQGGYCDHEGAAREHWGLLVGGRSWLGRAS